MRVDKKWARKYRKAFGCKTSTQIVCWCEVCCAIERAWEDAMNYAHQAIDEIRHPVNVCKEEKAKGE